jgi:hypothetical protein
LWALSALFLIGCQPEAAKAWLRADGVAPAAGELELAQTYCRGEVQKANMTAGSPLSVRQSMAEQDAYSGCMAGRGLLLKEIR